MIGFGIPEVFRHSRMQTLCLSPFSGGYAALYRSTSLINIGSALDVFFYGVDVWTVDSHGAVFCAGISPPLKPSEQTDGEVQKELSGKPTYSIQWKRDGNRICVLAKSNVFVLDTRELFSVDSVVAVGDAATSVRLRSIGSLFIPGTTALGSTNEFMFFCHEDGLILQYNWDMSFIGVVDISTTAMSINIWPPQRMSFGVQSRHVRVHHDGVSNPHRPASVTNLNPIYNDWASSDIDTTGASVGCTICSDGSMCFLLTLGSPVQDGTEPCYISERVFLGHCRQNGSKDDRDFAIKRHFLQTRFVHYADHYQAGDLAGGRDAIETSYARNRNIAIACLTAEDSNSFSCSLQIVVLLLSFSVDHVYSAVLSMLSLTILSTEFPTKVCFDRAWSSMEYPYDTVKSLDIRQKRVPEKSLAHEDNQPILTINGVRSDEIFVVLGGMIFCVKLEFRRTEEKHFCCNTFPVAMIKFSCDNTQYLASFTKTSVKYPVLDWRDIRIMVCFFSPRSELILVECTNVDIPDAPKEAMSAKASKHHHFPIYFCTSSFLVERTIDSTVNDIVFCRSTLSLHFPKRLSIGSKSLRTRRCPGTATHASHAKSDILSNSTLNVGKCFDRVAIPGELLGSVKLKQNNGFLVAMAPNFLHTAIIMNECANLGTLKNTYRANFCLLNNCTKRWKVFDMYSSSMRIINGESICPVVPENCQSLLVEACRWFGIHSCVFVALRGKYRTLEMFSTAGSVAKNKGLAERDSDGDASTASKLRKKFTPSAHAIFRFPPNHANKFRFSPVTQLDLCHHHSFVSRHDSSLVLGNIFHLVGFSVSAHFTVRCRKSRVNDMHPLTVAHYSISLPLWSIDLFSPLPYVSCKRFKYQRSGMNVFIRHPISQVLCIPTRVRGADATNTDCPMNVAIVDAVGQLFLISLGVEMFIQHIPLTRSICGFTPNGDNEFGSSGNFHDSRIIVKSLIPSYSHNFPFVEIVDKDCITFSVVLLCQESRIIDFLAGGYEHKPFAVRSFGRPRTFVWISLSENHLISCNFLCDNHEQQICCDQTVCLSFFSDVWPLPNGSHCALTIIKPVYSPNLLDCADLPSVPTNPVIYSHDLNETDIGDLFRHHAELPISSSALIAEAISIKLGIFLWITLSDLRELDPDGIFKGHRNSRGEKDALLEKILMSSSLLHGLWQAPKCLCSFVHSLELIIMRIVSNPEFMNPMTPEMWQMSDMPVANSGIIYAKIISVLLFMNEYIGIEIVSRVSRKLELCNGIKMFPLHLITDNEQVLRSSQVISRNTGRRDLHTGSPDKYLRFASNSTVSVEKSPELAEALFCFTNGPSREILDDGEQVIVTAELSSFLGIDIHTKEIDQDSLLSDQHSERQKISLNMEYKCGWSELAIFNHAMRVGDLNHAARLLPLAIARVMELQTIHAPADIPRDSSKFSYILALTLLSECWEHLYLNRLVQELLEFTGRVEYAMYLNSLVSNRSTSNECTNISKSWFAGSFLNSMWRFLDGSSTAAYDADEPNFVGSSESLSQNCLKQQLEHKLGLPSGLSAQLRAEMWEFDKEYPWNYIASKQYRSLYEASDVLSGVLSSLLSSFQFISVAFIINHSLQNIREVIAQRIRSTVSKGSSRPVCTGFSSEDVNLNPKCDLPNGNLWCSFRISKETARIVNHILSVFSVCSCVAAGDESLHPELIETLKNCCRTAQLFTESADSLLKKIGTTVPMPLLLSLFEAELESAEENRPDRVECLKSKNGNDQNERTAVTKCMEESHLKVFPPKYGQFKAHLKGKPPIFSVTHIFRLISLASIISSENFELAIICAFLSNDIECVLALKKLFGFPSLLSDEQFKSSVETIISFMLEI